MSKRPLKIKELIRILKTYGIEAMSKDRGKGSEIILIKPESPGSKRGPQYPIKNHGSGTEISIPVINALLRRFEIKDFWD